MSRAGRIRWRCGPRSSERESAARVARAIGATRMADGHTLDDQAETVLMGLVRGWGLDGMAGIAR